MLVVEGVTTLHIVTDYTLGHLRQVKNEQKKMEFEIWQLNCRMAVRNTELSKLKSGFDCPLEMPTWKKASKTKRSVQTCELYITLYQAKMVHVFVQLTSFNYRFITI